jgi:hypothetical protein
MNKTKKPRAAIPRDFQAWTHFKASLCDSCIRLQPHFSGAVHETYEELLTCSTKCGLCAFICTVISEEIATNPKAADLARQTCHVYLFEDQDARNQWEKRYKEKVVTLSVNPNYFSAHYGFPTTILSVKVTSCLEPCQSPLLFMTKKFLLSLIMLLQRFSSNDSGLVQNS